MECNIYREGGREDRENGTEEAEKEEEENRRYSRPNILETQWKRLVKGMEWHRDVLGSLTKIKAGIERV